MCVQGITLDAILAVELGVNYQKYRLGKKLVSSYGLASSLEDGSLAKDDEH